MSLEPLTSEEWAIYDRLPKEVRHALQHGVYRVDVKGSAGMYRRLRASVGPRRAARRVADSVRGVQEALLKTGPETPHRLARASLLWGR